MVNEIDLSHRSSVPGTQAIDRACALVSLVVRADEPLTFTEITDAAGLARSTTSRLLAALERNELLQRDASGAYVAGALFALHAARHDPWQETARVARPFLERLRDLTGETAHLGRPERPDGAPRRPGRLAVPARDPGLDGHRGARALQRAGQGALRPSTARLPRRRPRDPHRAERRRPGGPRAGAGQVRRQGWAATVDELEVGLTAVAAPVSGRDGEVVAALGVSGPTARLADRVDEMGRLLVEQAGSLSALLLRRTIKEGVA